MSPVRNGHPETRGSRNLNAVPHAAPASAPCPALYTLVVCDLVDSIALVERVGDARAIALMRRHDRAARDLLAAHRGREIDKTGGFLLLFDRPVEAVAFALGYQRLVRAIAREEAVDFAVRVGVHIGEAVVYENDAADVARGAKRVEVEGLVKPVAARLTELARPGQVLVSGTFRSVARRHDAELEAAFPAAIWRYHGYYEFKGVPDAMSVHEVGEAGSAPLARPASSDKAWRKRSRWLRPRALAAQLAVLVPAAAIVLYVAVRTQPAIAFAERDWIVLGELRNLSGEPAYDESVEAALRISLAESRHVNVLSDLAVRHTLVRMHRAKDATVDRATGAEIAIREGARALVVPTVSRTDEDLVRVTLEVIDPQTLTTAWSESAEGSGPPSVLRSIDRVSDRLRRRLGEDVAVIARNNGSLPKVATPSLGALRAYAMGMDKQSSSRLDEAIPLYREALEIDPGFSLAEMALARVYYSTDDYPRALEHLERALAGRDRLPARDRAYLEAWRHSFGAMDEGARRWRALAELYPDHFGAHYNHAFFTARAEARYRAALPHAEQSANPHNPFSASGAYLTGTLLMVLEDLDGALAAFRESEARGVGGTMFHYGATHAARRDWTAGDAVFARDPSSNVVANDVLDRRWPLLRALDHGRLDKARRAADAFALDAETMAPNQIQLFRTLAVALAYAGPVAEGAEARLVAHVESMTQALDTTVRPDAAEAAFRLAYLAALAGRAGHREAAHRALAAIGDAESYGLPNIGRMQSIARAELALSAGDADEALALVAPQLAGEGLYLAHAVALEAHAARGAYAEAAEEAHWLATHRGLAWGEPVANETTVVSNVAAATLAHLRGAELRLAAGDVDRARAEIDAFTTAWPDAHSVPEWAARMEHVRAALATREVASARP